MISFVSTDRQESSGRISTIGEILRVIGATCEPKAEEILLVDRRLIFRVVTCTIRGTVGFTGVMILADEMAMWESRDHSANPAAEVMGNLRPTMATQKFGFEVCSSSPWGTDDYHAQLVEAGDTPDQVLSKAETWVANPTLSEEWTHQLEPDEKLWARAYAIIPGAMISQALEPTDCANAFEVPPDVRTGRAFVCIDASSLRGDAFAWCAGYESANGLVVGEVDGVQDVELKTIKMGEVVARVAARAKAWKTDVVFGDQRETAGLEALFAQHGISLVTYAWSENSKHDAFKLLAQILKDERLSLAEHAELLKQMRNCKAHRMPSGKMRYATNGLDYLSAVVTLMHAVNNGDISLAPMAQVMVSPSSMLKRYVSALNV
jgi:hypothetical protein